MFSAHFRLLQVRDEDKSLSLSIPAIARAACHPHKSHVIVGGLGGFGLELAQWLVKRGARYLVLTSRTGVSTGYQNRYIRQWREAGVAVCVSTRDVTDADEARALLRDAASMCRDGVGSVFNLAAVMHDGLVVNQTAADWSHATKPKVSYILLEVDILHISHWRIQRQSFGGHMVSKEREPITGAGAEPPAASRGLRYQRLNFDG